MMGRAKSGSRISPCAPPRVARLEIVVPPPDLSCFPFYLSIITIFSNLNARPLSNPDAAYILLTASR